MKELKIYCEGLLDIDDLETDIKGGASEMLASKLMNELYVYTGKWSPSYRYIVHGDTLRVEVTAGNSVITFDNAVFTELVKLGIKKLDLSAVGHIYINNGALAGCEIDAPNSRVDIRTENKTSTIESDVHCRRLYCGGVTREFTVKFKHCTIQTDILDVVEGNVPSTENAKMLVNTLSFAKPSKFIQAVSERLTDDNIHWNRNFAKLKLKGWPKPITKDDTDVLSNFRLNKSAWPQLSAIFVGNGIYREGMLFKTQACQLPFKKYFTGWEATFSDGWQAIMVEKGHKNLLEIA